MYSSSQCRHFGRSSPMRDLGLMTQIKGTPTSLVILQLVIEFIYSLVGRYHFNHKIRRDLGPTLGNTPSGKRPKRTNETSGFRTRPGSWGKH